MVYIEYNILNINILYYIYIYIITLYVTMLLDVVSFIPLFLPECYL